ncbi:MAG: DUF2851 family protein [Bacteroidota bacterium]
MINEDFLHYTWKFQKWDCPHLVTSDEQQVTVFQTGFHNHDSGPDFEQARIKIGEMEWVGSVEIHVKSSDWNKHQHDANEAYKNVILHVVYEHDADIYLDDQPIPTLALKNLIDPTLIETYQKHIAKPDVIPCGSQLINKSALSYDSMLDKVLIERLERKATSVLEIVNTVNGDWEETSYRILASNFGFSVNKEAFKLLSTRLSFAVLKKNLHHPIKAEALLFGQAGFLEDIENDYQDELKTEHHYLSSKYSLPLALKKHQWKFARMRPANFPSVRLAQFSGFLVAHPQLFYALIEMAKPKELINSLKFEVSDYWKLHYDFGKKRKKEITSMGNQAFEHLLINSVAPILAAYSKYSNHLDYMNRAISILEEIRPEQNRMTKHWSALGKAPQSAFESQAQIQLLDAYCTKRKCLSCAIGVSLLNND